METLIGVLRCFLPRRYWQEMRRGAILSILLTLALGLWVGMQGLFDSGTKAGNDAAALALKVGAPGSAVGGMDQTAQVAAALQSPILAVLAFFFFTPRGWLADYLFISGIFRGITLAVDNPWGDPILTGLDHLIRGKRETDRARAEAQARERAEGPEVPDQILECRKFAGKEADYVVVASRRKDGWTKATTVMANDVRLRIGDPLEKTLEGRLRTCYPLKVIRDIQVDRRMVRYYWPKDAPPLPDPTAEAGE